MKKAYFIVGPHGVGKTYMVNELKKQVPGIHVDTGPIIRNIYKQHEKEQSLDEWIKVGEEKHGENFSNELICKYMAGTLDCNNCENLFVTGNRSVSGIKHIIDYFNIEKPVIIYLDSSVDTLKQNYESREELNLSNEEFNNIINREKESGLAELKEYVLNNSKDCIYVYRGENSDLSSNAIWNMANENLSDATGKFGDVL